MANKFTDAMTALAVELVSEPSWQPYADYCQARASNLHERAGMAAERFTEAARRWPFEERKRFALWLMNSTGWIMEKCGASRFEWRYSTGGSGLFAPRRAVEEVLLPTLVQWRKEEPTNSEPYFWLGLYDKNPESDLRAAIRLKPAHGPARAALAVHFLKAVSTAQHELPSGYIGEPTDDLITLSDAEALLTDVVDASVRAPLEEKISALRAVAEDWVSLRDQLRGLDWDARSSIWQARPRHRPVQKS